MLCEGDLGEWLIGYVPSDQQVHTAQTYAYSMMKKKDAKFYSSCKLWPIVLRNYGKTVKMKYYRTNNLIIEYPTTFLGRQVEARTKWKVAWTELHGDKVRIVPKGKKMSGKFGKRGYKIKRSIILVDLHCSKERFIDEISRYFSEKLNVSPSKIKFQFEHWTPFGDLNA